MTTSVLTGDEYDGAQGDADDADADPGVFVYS